MIALYALAAIWLASLVVLTVSLLTFEDDES